MCTSCRRWRSDEPNEPQRSGRVIRGGCWFASGLGGTDCKAALRGRELPRGFEGLGLRLARAPVQSK